MKKMRNPYTIAPGQLGDGVVMTVTVTCHVREINGQLRFRLYRCPYPVPQDNPVDGVPQGDRVWTPEEAGTARALFPVLGYVNAIPDDL